eukprot:TRINITY_DN31823_c0_g1_i2.p1 TRINITY_DN31823_c0_g1~~TRINITY_DN31823_c0_g1_i2.p1  ORF type:complete len:172 (+),score=6.30 TRINITY_DN31823_c0_g1_i2:179-694(+)
MESRLLGSRTLDAAMTADGKQRASSVYARARSSLRRVSETFFEGGCPEEVLGRVVLLVNVFEPVLIVATALLFLLLPLRANGQIVLPTQVAFTCVVKPVGEMFVDRVCAYQFSDSYMTHLGASDPTILGVTFIVSAGYFCFLTPQWVLASWCVYPHADDPRIVASFGLCGA